MVAVTVTSLLRHRIGQRAWRAIHWLAYAAWPVAVLHGIGTGTDAMSVWMIAIDAVCVVTVGAAAVWRIRAAPRDPLAMERRAAVARASGGAVQ